jgi:hypothetical protein
MVVSSPLHPRLSGCGGALLLHDFMTAEGVSHSSFFCASHAEREYYGVLPAKDSGIGGSSFVHLAGWRYVIFEDCLANHLQSVQHVVVRYFLNGLSAI